MNSAKNVIPFTLEYDENKENVLSVERKKLSAENTDNISKHSVIVSPACSVYAQSTDYFKHSTCDFHPFDDSSISNLLNVNPYYLEKRIVHRHEPMGSEASECASDLRNIFPNQKHGISSSLKNASNPMTNLESPVIIAPRLVGQSFDIKSNINRISSVSSTSSAYFTCRDFKDDLSFKVEKLLGEKIQSTHTFIGNSDYSKEVTSQKLRQTEEFSPRILSVSPLANKIKPMQSNQSHFNTDIPEHFSKASTSKTIGHNKLPHVYNNISGVRSTSGLKSDMTSIEPNNMVASTSQTNFPQLSNNVLFSNRVNHTEIHSNSHESSNEKCNSFEANSLICTISKPTISSNLLGVMKQNFSSDTCNPISKQCFSHYETACEKSVLPELVNKFQSYHMNEDAPELFVESTDRFQSLQSGNRSLSPMSVSSIASNKPLEWDNGADIGYSDFTEFDINSKQSTFIVDEKNKLNINAVSFAYNKCSLSKETQLSRVSNNLQHFIHQNDTNRDFEDGKQLPMASTINSSYAPIVNDINFSFPLHDSKNLEICINDHRKKPINCPSTSFNSLSSNDTFNHRISEDLKYNLSTVTKNSGVKNTSAADPTDNKFQLPPSANTNRYLCLRPINAENIARNKQEVNSLGNKLPYAFHSPYIAMTTEHKLLTDISDAENLMEDRIIWDDGVFNLPGKNALIPESLTTSCKSVDSNLPKKSSIVFINPADSDLLPTNRNSGKVMIVNASCFENLLSANQEDHPHIRWYPLCENSDLQERDTKHAATQTSVSYLSQQSLEKTATSLKDNYHNLYTEEVELITLLESNRKSNINIQESKSVAAEREEEINVCHTCKNSQIDVSSLKDLQEKNFDNCYCCSLDELNKEENKVKHSFNLIQDSILSPQNLCDKNICSLSVFNHYDGNDYFENASRVTRTQFSACETTNYSISNGIAELPTACNIIDQSACKNILDKLPHVEFDNVSEPNFFLFNGHAHVSSRAVTSNSESKFRYKSKNNAVSTIPKHVWNAFHEENNIETRMELKKPYIFKRKKGKEDIIGSLTFDTVPTSTVPINSMEEPSESCRDEKIELNDKNTEPYNSDSSYFIKISKVNLQPVCKNDSTNVDIGEPIIHISQHVAVKLEKVGCIDEKPIYVVNSFPKQPFYKNNISGELSAHYNQAIKTQLSQERHDGQSSSDDSSQYSSALYISSGFDQLSISSMKTCSESSLTISEFTDASSDFDSIICDEKEVHSKHFQKIRAKHSKIENHINVKPRNLYKSQQSKAQVSVFNGRSHRLLEKKPNDNSSYCKKKLKSSARSKYYLRSSDDIKKIKEISYEQQKVHNKLKEHRDQFLQSWHTIITDYVDVSPIDCSTEISSVFSNISKTSCDSTHDSTCNTKDICTQSRAGSFSNGKQDKMMMNDDTDVISSQCEINKTFIKPFKNCKKTALCNNSLKTDIRTALNIPSACKNVQNQEVVNVSLHSTVSQSHDFDKDYTAIHLPGVTKMCKNAYSISSLKKAPVSCERKNVVIMENIAWVIPFKSIQGNMYAKVISPISLQDAFLQYCGNARRNIDIRKSLITKLKETRLCPKNAKNTKTALSSSNGSKENCWQTASDINISLDNIKQRKVYFKKLHYLTRLTTEVVQPRINVSISDARLKNRLQQKVFGKKLMMDVVHGHVNWLRSELVIPSS